MSINSSLMSLGDSTAYTDYRRDIENIEREIEALLFPASEIPGSTGPLKDQLQHSLRTAFCVSECYGKAKEEMLRLSDCEIKKQLSDRARQPLFEGAYGSGKKYVEFLALMVVMRQRFDDGQLFELYSKELKESPKKTSFIPNENLLLNQINQIKNKKQSEIQDRLNDRSSELRQKDGANWKCLECKRVDGGCIYRFVYLPTKKEEELFPAIEPDQSLSFNNSNRETEKKMGQLGYLRESQLGLEYLELPDSALLLQRAQALGVGEGLHIIDSPGIAEDLQFAEWMTKGYLIISEGAEFVHDHVVHVTAYFENKFNAQEAQQQILQQKTAEFIEICKLADEILKNSSNAIGEGTTPYLGSKLSVSSIEQIREIHQTMLARLKATTGAVADAFSSISFMTGTESAFKALSFEDILTDMWSSDDWNTYFNKRFEDDGLGRWEPTSPEELILFSRRIRQIQMESLV